MRTLLERLSSVRLLHGDSRGAVVARLAGAIAVVAAMIAGAVLFFGSGTPTPRALPKTGGAGGSGDSLTIVFALALGALLIAAAGGSVLTARAKREE